MRKIFLFGLLILIAVQMRAQQVQYFSSELNYKDSIISGGIVSGGGVAFFDKKGKILYNISVHPLPNTNIYYPVNKIDNFTNLVYFNNADKFRLQFSLSHEIDLNAVRYRILRDRDTSLWKIPDGRFVKQNDKDGSYYTNIFMPDLLCKNEVIKIQLYNINDPESVLTQIVSTKSISNALLLSDAEIFNPEVNKISKKPGIEFSFNLGYPFLYDYYNIKQINAFAITDNTPYIYNLQLIERSGGKSDTIPLNVEWQEIDINLLRSKSYFVNQLNDNSKKSYWAVLPAFPYKIGIQYTLRLIPKFNNPKVFTSSVGFNQNEIKFSRLKYVSGKDRMIRYAIVFCSAVIIALSIIFIYNRRKSKRRLIGQQHLTAEAKLKLQSLRSQLNPHFVFNALSGIQNLMNKNETEKANTYLNTFSRLTRNVLDDSANETITLNNEIKLLDDYLKMEQLRFGFRYNIRVDDNLDKHNIEIPSMLLQPFAENAVKHGIAALKENGNIDIDFTKSGNNLVLSVADNGAGFDANDSYKGMGLQLSKNRISLLNTVYKNTPFNLQINSSGKGTEAIITLQNWLS